MYRDIHSSGTFLDSFSSCYVFTYFKIFFFLLHKGGALVKEGKEKEEGKLNPKHQKKIS